jgi:hypothetical protein
MHACKIHACKIHACNYEIHAREKGLWIDAYTRQRSLYAVAGFVPPDTSRTSRATISSPKSFLELQRYTRLGDHASNVY